MAETDLARSLGRLEAERDAAATRVAKLEERMVRLERIAAPARRELGTVAAESKSHSLVIAGHEIRIVALEGPAALAKAEVVARRDRMRRRVKHLGVLATGMFVVAEWIAKPAIEYITAQWMRGVGH